MSNAGAWDAKPSLMAQSSSPSNNASTTSGRSTKLLELIRRYWSPLSILASLAVSAVPYILFLLVYGANELIRVLPTAKSGQSPTVRLHNVSSWEAAVLPFSVNRAVAAVSVTPLDLLSAVPYLAHYVLPVVYPLALVVLAGRVDCAQRFYRMVGWTMWVHYVVWYLLPTAPPWFYDGQAAALQQLSASRTLAAIAAPAAPGQPPAAGANAAASVGGASSASPPALIVPEHREGAAFARVDRLTGVGFFYGLFAGNPVPFAAFPSGHVAWPTCMLLTLPTTVRRLPFVVYVCVVAWATMYSSHHYLSDVIAALVVVFVVDRVLQGWSTSRFSLGGAGSPGLPTTLKFFRSSPSSSSSSSSKPVHHHTANGFLNV